MTLRPQDKARDGISVTQLYISNGKRSQARGLDRVENLEADRAVPQDKISTCSVSLNDIITSTTESKWERKRRCSNDKNTLYRPSTQSFLELSRSQGDISVTQLYSDNHSLKEQMDSERRHVRTLKHKIDGMMIRSLSHPLRSTNCWISE